MPLVYPDDLVPQRLTTRTLNNARKVLQAHWAESRRGAGPGRPAEWVEEVMLDHAPAIRDQGLAIWQAQWEARSADDTVQNVVERWRTALHEWVTATYIENES